jgi:hypothetical protein
MLLLYKLYSERKLRNCLLLSHFATLVLPRRLKAVCSIARSSSSYQLYISTSQRYWVTTRIRTSLRKIVQLLACHGGSANLQGGRTTSILFRFLTPLNQVDYTRRLRVPSADIANSNTPGGTRTTRSYASDSSGVAKL